MCKHNFFRDHNKVHNNGTQWSMTLIFVSAVSEVQHLTMKKHLPTWFGLKHRVIESGS